MNLKKLMLLIVSGLVARNVRVSVGETKRLFAISWRLITIFVLNVKLLFCILQRQNHRFKLFYSSCCVPFFIKYYCLCTRTLSKVWPNEEQHPLIGFVQTDLVLFFKIYVYIVNVLSQMMRTFCWNIIIPKLSIRSCFPFIL